ncbi:MAG: hypothetical protein K1X83_05405 [Oligoflexia bacterium]|nr:hypothetical protein [Oligoflexia bacterium]
MDLQRFRALSEKDRALVAVAVLMDGRDAGVYLENDAQSGAVLKRAADDLAAQELELRMTYAATQLRAALKEG